MNTEKQYTITIFAPGKKERAAIVYKKWLAIFYVTIYNMFTSKKHGHAVWSFNRYEHEIIETFQSLDTQDGYYKGLRFIQQIPLEVAKIVHQRMKDIKYNEGVKVGWTYKMPQSPVPEDNAFLKAIEIYINEFGRAIIVVDNIKRVYFDFETIKLLQ